MMLIAVSSVFSKNDARAAGLSCRESIEPVKARVVFYVASRHHEKKLTLSFVICLAFVIGEPTRWQSAQGGR